MIGTHIVNLIDLIDDGRLESIKPALDEYSCPMNKDVEDFFKYKAVEFAK